MKSILSLLSLAIFILIISGCAQSIEEKQLVNDDENITIKLEAVVHPSIYYNILSPYDAKVETVYVKNGSHVKQGDPLYKFDFDNLNLDIKNLENEIKVITRQSKNVGEKYIVHSELDDHILQNAKHYLEKITALHADGYATESELSNAKNDYYRAKKEYDALSSSIREKRRDKIQNKDELSLLINTKQSELKKALQQIKNASVRSPYDGYLINSTIKVGNNINKSSVMSSIINIDNVTVKAGLAPGLYRFIKAGDSVDIDFIVTPPYSVEANITRVIPVIDPTIGRMLVEIELKNSDYILQDGMKAMVRIKLNKDAQKIVKKYFIDKKGQKVLNINTELTSKTQ